MIISSGSTGGAACGAEIGTIGEGLVEFSKVEDALFEVGVIGEISFEVSEVKDASFDVCVTGETSFDMGLYSLFSGAISECLV